MHILICGASGQIGQALLATCPDTWTISAPSSSHLDISQPTASDIISRQIKPDLIINAAAYTAVDLAESHQEQAYAVNYLGCKYLAIAAKKCRCPLLHISTDYVFNGSNDKPYLEVDQPQPINLYGASKLAGELVIQEICSQFIILRTSWVFSAYGTNFVKSMLRLSPKAQLSIVNDQQGAPTSAQGIAQALWQITQCYQQQRKLQAGIYHFSGAPYCSWYDFAQAIFSEAYRQKLITQIPKLVAIDSSQYPTVAKRPLSSKLNCKKILRQFAIKPDNWQLQLEHMLKQITAEK